MIVVVVVVVLIVSGICISINTSYSVCHELSNIVAMWCRAGL